ncbi:conserved hypothetical protein [Candidatus Roizmanbacteria bacterium]|nr:conserved hypothetical protein [Candidatus Roizmanbacteria bacterium]
MSERRKLENRKSPVLCINAHPDDESFGFGGIMSKFIQIKRPAYIASLTAGDAGQSAIPLVKSLSEIRRDEVFSATSTLGFSPDQIYVGSLPDGRLNEYPDEVINLTRSLFDKFKPGLILTMHPQSTSHPDHIAVAQAVLELKQKGELSNSSVLLQYLPGKYIPTPDEIITVLPIQKFLKKKIEAIKQHQTQKLDADRIIPKLLHSEHFVYIR